MRTRKNIEKHPWSILSSGIYGDTKEHLFPVLRNSKIIDGREPRLEIGPNVSNSVYDGTSNRQNVAVQEGDLWNGVPACVKVREFCN